MAKDCRSCKYRLQAVFKKPTIEQLKEYAKSIGWTNFDADYFYWKNESVGWVDRRGIPYKSWKGIVQTWKRAAKQRGEFKEQKETVKEKYLKENSK